MIIAVLSESNSTELPSKKFTIRFTCNSTEKWEVERSVSDFVELKEKLYSTHPSLATFPVFHDVHNLEQYLNQILREFTCDKLWNAKPLLHFIDNSTSSMSKMSEIYVSLMQKQVDELKAQNTLYDKKFEDLQKNYRQLLSVVNMLAGHNVSATGSADKTAAVAEESSATDDVTSGVVSKVSQRSPGTLQRSLAINIPDLNVTGIAAVPANEFYLSPDEREQQKTERGQWYSEPTDSEELGLDSARGSESMAAYLKISQTSHSSVSPSPTFVLSRANSENNTVLSAITPSIATVDLDAVVAATESLAVAPAVSLHSVSQDTPRQSTPRVVSNCPMDLVVDHMVDVLAPHESQTQYRASVVNMIRNQNRLCLNSSATVEIGLHTLSWQLPDDPLVLSVIFCRSSGPNWYKAVLNRLLLIVDRPPGSQQFEEEAPRAPVPHVVSNIHYSDSANLAPSTPNSKPPPLTESRFKVHCAADALEVEIVPNARADLCLLAFFDEFAQLVSQDNLFKRSVLLIRAWWVYETASYVGSVIKHYITDNAMVLMVAALFNVHHKELATPLAALSMFMRVYSKYDGFSEVITLQGVVPYGSQKAPNSTAFHVTLVPPDETHLVSAALVEKYFKMLNLPGADVAKPAAPAIGQVGSEGEVFESATVVSSVSSQANTPRDSLDGATTPSTPKSLSSAPLHIVVERNGYQVVNPFSYTNLIPEKMTTRRVVLIHKAFQIGSANLAAITNQKVAHDQLAAECIASGKAAPALSSQSANEIQGFFPSSMARFKDNWRPDAVGNTIEKPSSVETNGISTNVVSEEGSVHRRLLKEIQYCNFVLESIVTEAVVVNITAETLSLKGALPVGEIGKLLTDQSAITHLSQRMKELFGGLKKLLEKYSDLFIVAANHQFNPHVCLRSLLTPEQEGLILSGVFPAEIFAKTSKQKLGVQQTYEQHQFSPQGNMGMVPNQLSGMRSASPSNGVPGYLSYNVNTSLDRRMRQQMMSAAGQSPSVPVINAVPRAPSQSTPQVPSQMQYQTQQHMGVNKKSPLHGQQGVGQQPGQNLAYKQQMAKLMQQQQMQGGMGEWGGSDYEQQQQPQQKMYSRQQQMAMIAQQQQQQRMLAASTNSKMAGGVGYQQQSSANYLSQHQQSLVPNQLRGSSLGYSQQSPLGGSSAAVGGSLGGFPKSTSLPSYGAPSPRDMGLGGLHGGAGGSGHSTFFSVDEEDSYSASGLLSSQSAHYYESHDSHSFDTQMSGQQQQTQHSGGLHSSSLDHTPDAFSYLFESGPSNDLLTAAAVDSLWAESTISASSPFAGLESASPAGDFGSKLLSQQYAQPGRTRK